MAIITTTILSVLATSTTISNASMNLNLPDSSSSNSTSTSEGENKTLEVIEEVVEETVNNSSLLLSDEEVVENVIDSLQEQVFDNSIDPVELQALKSATISQVTIIRNSDVVIGTGTVDRLITMGQNEEDDKFIFFLINFLVGQYYPELRNISPGYVFNNLPDPSSSYYQSRITAMQSAFNARPILIEDMQNDIEYRFENSIPLKRLQRQYGSSYLFQSYQFEYLDDLLKELNDDLTLLMVASGITLLGAFLLMFIPGGQPASIALGIASSLYSLGTIAPFLGQNYFELNDYELAIINHYSSIYTQPIKFKNIKQTATQKALDYYGRFYSKNNPAYVTSSSYIPIGGEYGNTYDGNNSLDAYRHTFWNAMMAHEFGQEASKSFADAHEYGPLMDGTVDTNDEKLALDMDLLNNESGRKIGDWWDRNGNWFRGLSSQYPEISSDDWTALAYYAFHCVSYGYYSGYDIYTFGDRNGNNIYDVVSEDYRIDDYSSRIVNNHGTTGLVNTNFGEKSKFLLDNNASYYPLKSYFFYPPFC